MNEENLKKLVHDFIAKHSIGVLATTTAEGKPEAAVITIIVTDGLEIIFETFTNYRKYQNLKKNSSIALIVGWDEKITVQYEGIAEELYGDALQKYKGEYFLTHLKLKKWDDLPEMVWFKISPKWARYLDNNTDPRTVYEITF